MSIEEIVGDSPRELQSVALSPITIRIISGPVVGISVALTVTILILLFSSVFQAPIMVLWPLLFPASLALIYALTALVKLRQAKPLMLTASGLSVGDKINVEWENVVSIEDHWVSNLRGGRFRDGVELTLREGAGGRAIVIPQIYCKGVPELRGLMRSYWWPHQRHGGTGEE